MASARSPHHPPLAFEFCPAFIITSITLPPHTPHPSLPIHLNAAPQAAESQGTPRSVLFISFAHLPQPQWRPPRWTTRPPTATVTRVCSPCYLSSASSQLDPAMPNACGPHLQTKLLATSATTAAPHRALHVIMMMVADAVLLHPTATPTSEFVCLLSKCQN